MKRAISITMIIFMIALLVMPEISSAEGSGDIQQTEEDNSWWGKIFQGVLSVIMKPFEDIPEPADYIFNTDESKRYGLFTDDEWEKAVVPGTYFVTICVATLLIASIVLDGVKLSATAFNPATRQYIVNQSAVWVVVALLLANIWYIIDLIFYVNGLLVDTFGSLINPDGVNMQDLTADVGGGLIGKAIVDLMYMIGINIWMAFYYTTRKWMLTILIILSPLFISLFLFPRMRAVTAAWFKEFTATVFAQSIHAVMFWVFVSTNTAGVHWFTSLVLLMSFIPISESIRFLLGATGGDSKIATGATLMGFGAIMSAGQVLKTARQGFNEMFSESGARHVYHDRPMDTGTGTIMNTSNNTAALGGVTSRGATMLKGGMLGKTIGRGALGVAGAIGAAPLGTFGAFVGANIGADVGSLAGGVAGRTATAAGMGAVRIGQETYAFGRDSGEAVREHYSQAIQNIEEPGILERVKTAAQATRTGIVETAADRIKTLNETHFNDPAKRQRFYAHTGSMVLGTIGGSTGYQVGGSLGAAIGQRDIIRAQRKGDFPSLSTGELPAFHNVVKDDRVVARHAIPYRVVTTANDSYLERAILNDAGEIQGYERVGTFGSGDPTLKPGEKVYKDYRLHVNDENQKIFVPYAPKSSMPENFDQSGRVLRTENYDAQVTMPDNYKLDEHGGRMPTRQGSVSSPEAYLLNDLRMRRLSRGGKR